MTPQRIARVETTITRVELGYALVAEGSDVCAYHMFVARTRLGASTTLSEMEGLTSRARCEAFSNEAESLPTSLSGYGPSGHTAYLTDPTFRDLLRTEGWSDATRKALGCIPDPYTRLTNGSSDAKDVVLAHSEEHVTDAMGARLPVAVRFGDMGGYVHNGAYDLSRALEVLKARSDVRFEPGDKWRGAPDSIQAIPYYNTESGRDRCLVFVWMPSAEDYLRMVTQCETYGRLGMKSAGSYSERYRAVFDLDLLGLRAGGAALHDDFFKTRAPNEE